MKCLHFLITVGVFILTGCGEQKSVMGFISSATGGTHTINHTPVRLTVLVAGQSNAVRFTPEGEQGAMAELNQHFSDIQVTFINCAENGTSISQWQVGQGRLENCANVVNGRHIDVLYWYQGETDAMNQTPNYDSLTLSTWDQFNQAYGSGLKIIYSQIGTTTFPAMLAGWQAIKDAQTGFQRSGRPMLYTADLPLEDTVHIDGNGQHELGKRFAQALMDIL